MAILMKLVRNAATTFDSERKEHRRNRGRTHFYQVEGNAEHESEQLALVDAVLFSIQTISDEAQSWHERACLCADYSEGYACNYAVELDEVEDFKGLWKLVKAQVTEYAKTFGSIPTNDNYALNILGYAIAGKIVRNSNGKYELHDRVYKLAVKWKSESEERQKARAEKAAAPVEVESPAAEQTAPVQKTEGGKKIHITPETKADEIKSFRLVSPCKECPYRSDLPSYLKGWLGRERATEIARNVFDLGQSFPCHKTTEHDDRKLDQGYTHKGCESQCAGASIMQIKLGKTSAYMQVAERLGWTKEIEAMQQLDLDSPVFETVADFIEFHSR